MAESALRALIPRPQEIVAPVRSWNPLNPAFRDTLSSAMTNMLGASNVAGREGYDRSRYADMLTGAVDFVPGAGEAAGVGDVRREVQQGNYPGAALAGVATALGVIPVIGDVAGKAVRGAGDALDASRAAPSIPDYSEFRIEDYVSPKKLFPPHEVRDQRKLSKLTDSMIKNGWQGRPILVVDLGQGDEAITGSHRIAAAKDAGIDVPVVRVDADIGDYINDSGESIRDAMYMDADDMAEFFEKAGYQDAAKIMRLEYAMQEQ